MWTRTVRMAKKKYYVVWEGVTPGIYDSWSNCQLQIKGYEGAKYKSFLSKEEAEKAYNGSPFAYIGKSKKPQVLPTNSNILLDSIAVDAACSGNPGPMEYRGVYVKTNQELFHYKAALGTNNIGEFLALVHGLAFLQQKKSALPIYTDSKIALSWIKQKKCKTKLQRNPATEPLFDMIERAEKWLKNNRYTTILYKWDTKQWGEIPADFGRK